MITTTANKMRQWIEQLTVGKAATRTTRKPQRYILRKNRLLFKKTGIVKPVSDPNDPDTCWIGKGRGSSILKSRKPREKSKPIQNGGLPGEMQSKMEYESGDADVPKSSGSKLPQSKAGSTGQISKINLAYPEERKQAKGSDNEDLSKREGRKYASARSIAVRSASPAGQVRMRTTSVDGCSDNDQTGMVKARSSSSGDWVATENVSQSTLTHDETSSVINKVKTGQLGKRGRKGANTNILERAQSFEKKISESESSTPRQLELSKRVQSSIRSKFTDLEDTSEKCAQRRSSDNERKIPRAVPSRLLRRADTQPKLQVSSSISVERAASEPQIDNIRRVQLGPKPTIAEQEAFIRSGHFPGTSEPPGDGDTSGEESSKSQADETEKRSPVISPLAHDIQMWRSGSTNVQTAVKVGLNKTVHDLTNLGLDYRTRPSVTHDTRPVSDGTISPGVTTETDTANEDSCTVVSDGDSTPKESTRSSVTTEADLDDVSTLSAFSQDEQDFTSQTDGETKSSLVNKSGLGIRHPGSQNKKKDKSSMSSVMYAKRIQQWADRERDQTRTQNDSQKELFQVNSQVKTSRSSESDKNNAENNSEQLCKELQVKANKTTMSSRIHSERNLHKGIESKPTILFSGKQEGKPPGNSPLGTHGERNQHEAASVQPRGGGFQRSQVYFQTGKVLHRQAELDTKRPSTLTEKTTVISNNVDVQRQNYSVTVERQGFTTKIPADADPSNSSRLLAEAKSTWNTDSDTDISTGEEQLETDSSVCNVIEERRRRRLVKRTKKRASRCRKLKREDYHSVGSASDESGALSRASSLDRYDDGHRSEDYETVITAQQSSRFSSCGRKFSHPVFSAQKIPQPTVRGFPSSPLKSTMKSASTSTFHQSHPSQRSSFDMGSRSDQEGRDGRLISVGKLGSFSSVAKVAKITIPSIKSFQKTRNFTPPTYSAKRVLSDSESYISTSMSELKDYSTCQEQEQGIIDSPFNFRKYRGYGERYSDDEHEMTARLERFEELSSTGESGNLRRCNTLPRNIGAKYRVKESPFKLTLPGRTKPGQDAYTRADGYSSKVELVGFTNSPFSLKQNENLLSGIPCRVSSNLPSKLDENIKESTPASVSTDQGKTNQILSDVKQDVLQNSLKSSEDLLSSSSLTDYPSNVINQTIRQYGLRSDSDVLASSPTSRGNTSLRESETYFKRTTTNETLRHGNDNNTPVIGETFIPVIEPPDCFKDSPCPPEEQTSFASVNDDNNNNDHSKFTERQISEVGDSLAEQISNFLQDIENEVGLSYNSRTNDSSYHDSTVPREGSTSNNMVSLSFPEDEDIEFPFSRRGTESPRRRPSYIKAQDSILTDMIDIVGDLPSVVPPPPGLDESVVLDGENNDYNGSSEISLDAETKTSDDSLHGRRGKRARPRIPSVLDPVKSSSGDTTQVSEHESSQEGAEFKRSGRKEDGGSDSDELPTLDLSKVEKMESVKKRTRPVLAVTPILEGIPEEKGGDPSRGGKRVDDRSEGQSHRKSRKSKKQNPQSPTSLVEEVLSEGLDERVDSPKNERDDKSETGYYSQSSELLSTPSQLSIDEISQDGSECQDIQYLKTKGFRKSRTLDAYKDSEKNGDSIRSKSDPLPDGLSSDETKRINETINDIEVYSNSEPNLIPRDKSSKDNTRRAVSNQDVVQRESPKGSRKERDRKGSGDSAVDTLSPTSESVSFDSAFESMNSKSQLIIDNALPLPAETPVPQKKIKEKPDMRRHVLQNLLETEKSYVQNLNYVVTMVYKPLKKPESSSVIEPQLVDEIFFQIPEILVNHEFFLEQLTNRVNNWHERQVIGDIFISSFRKCLLMDAYSTFISHYLQARAAVRQATQARPSFGKFLEQCTKDHKEKLTLQDLMIMPVQRIPRYTLILKDMLKHTDVDHPDYGNLQLAIGEIKTLAERMNKGEMEADQAEREAERLRDIEATIEGVMDLVATNRKFIRQDLVAEVRGVITKKDRCLFLFSDLLLCATVKRKTTALRRGSLGLFSGQSATDFNKYKLLWKIPLEDIELVKSSSSNSLNRRGSSDKQVEKLEEDVSILSNVSALTDSLTIPHQNLDICIRELMADLNKQISERSQVSQAQPPPMTRVELQVQVDDGVEFFLFVFLSAEIKSSWEAYFEDAKQKLAYCRDTFPPEFQYSMPITKTRSGMQFTCAAPSHLNSHGELHYDQSRGDVWVCNSDGYVGQVCLLAVVPKAEPKAVLSVCSARIQCISPVPGARLVSSTRSPRTSFDTRKLPQIPEVAVPKKSKLSPKLSSPSPRLRKSIPSESDEEDQPPGPETIIAFDSSDEEDGDVGTGFIGGSTVFGGRMSPDGSSLGTADSMEGEHDSSGHENHSDYGGNDSSEDDDHGQQESSRRISMPIGSAMRRGSHGYTLKGSLDDLLGSDIDEQPTMWLGTEDGSIYVYQANEAAAARKSKMKMQLGAAVNAILYVDNKVFVALASGELCVYKRDAGAGWEVATPQTVQVGTTGTPITCVAAVAGRIWCGCQNNAILVNAATLKVEKTLTVSSDPHRSVYKIAGSGLGVWVSLQSSAVIRLYHATTLENLTDIDVAPAVHKMLAGADAIIRQHKAACLRVTALLTCKDQLWIGTSAGVILTNPLPPITMNTQSLRHTPGPSGSPHGHTGHVRFLTAVEVPKSQYKSLETNGMDTTSQSTSPSGKNKQRELKVRPNEHDNVKTVTLVMSGGDGYEDFRSSAASEAVGRDDSTNHLLIWRV